MRKKEKPKPNEFILSQSASNFRLEFARNAKDPSLILKESCGQTKLEVLKTHPELEEWQWLRKQVKKWIKEDQDTVDEISSDLVIKTVPKRVRTRQWTYFLEPYLEKAAKGFFNNFRQKQYRRKRVGEPDIQENRGIENEEKEYKMFGEILRLRSISERQKRIVILIGLWGHTHDEVAKQLKIKSKTVQRDMDALDQDKDFRDILDQRNENVPYQSDQHKTKEVMLYASYQCKKCKKIFLSPYLVTLEVCKDHEGLEEA